MVIVYACDSYSDSCSVSHSDSDSVGTVRVIVTGTMILIESVACRLVSICKFLIGLLKRYAHPAEPGSMIVFF